ncbi:hypothetical protein [Streptomyces flavofungini]|uniref:hypothetical protein n=1 Tax=Streptomyces flavofungini TaxID=68200 RepID=UPI0034DE3571
MGWIDSKQQERDHNGQRNTCVGCGRDGTTAGRSTTSMDLPGPFGWRSIRTRRKRGDR